MHAAASEQTPHGIPPPSARPVRSALALLLQEALECELRVVGHLMLVEDLARRALAVALDVVLVVEETQQLLEVL